jgi:hypothetical protein
MHRGLMNGVLVALMMAAVVGVAIIAKGHPGLGSGHKGVVIIAKGR